ncbi:MAG: complex I subunit 5 family protein, partial [Chloroflexota bacterium]
PLQGALNFAIINTIGAYLILCGIALVYARTGALNFAQIGRALGTAPSDGLVTMAFVLIACGFLVKAAIVPFHFWLPDAHAVAPTPVCVLFSGVMVELGVYGVARIYWTMFAGPFGPHLAAIRAILIGFGAATAILGAIFCLSEEHIKRLLAFSTISHAGLFVIGLGLLTPLGLAGAAVYVLGHGLVKASLFMGAGILLNQFQTVSEAELFGRGRRLVTLGGVFLVGGLALAGLPPFGTALGKGMIEAAAGQAGDAWLSIVIIVASALTGGAVLRVAGRVFLGLGQPEARPDQAGADSEAEEPESARQARIPTVMILPTLVLLAGGLVSGLVPNIALHTEQAAAAFMNERGYSHVVLDGAARLVPNAPLVATGPDLSEVASGLGSAVAAVLIGLLAIYRRQLPAALRRVAARHLEPRLQRLRGLQSGDVRDYATWLTFGVAAMGLAFAFAVR